MKIEQRATQKIFIVPDGRVRDYIDGKIRKETPEEYEERQRREIEEYRRTLYED